MVHRGVFLEIATLRPPIRLAIGLIRIPIPAANAVTVGPYTIRRFSKTASALRG